MIILLKILGFGGVAVMLGYTAIAVWRSRDTRRP